VSHLVTHFRIGSQCAFEARFARSEVVDRVAALEAILHAPKHDRGAEAARAKGRVVTDSKTGDSAAVVVAVAERSGAAVDQEQVQVEHAEAGSEGVGVADEVADALVCDGVAVGRAALPTGKRHLLAHRE
jgi:hypothetical protein